MHFTLSQAAKEARVSKSTLSKAVSHGRLTAERLGDGSFRIDASELFRVFPKKPGEPENGGEQREQREQVEERPGTQAVILRERLNAAQDQLKREQEDRERERQAMARERATWERERETILERERVNAEDLRRRLDKAEERILALAAPVPEKAQERPVALAPEVTLAKASKGFLRRLLGQ